MGGSRGKRVSRASLLALLVAAGALAQERIPAEIEGWRDWALHGEEFRRCPFLGNTSGTSRAEHICAWPGRLELTVSEEGARFTESWVSHAPGWIPLPGDAEHWPQEVTLNGAPAAVVNCAGVPCVHVGEGSLSFAGRFAWSRRPETLGVPPAVGLVALTLNGRPVDLIERTESAVWLGKQRSADVAQHLAVQVYRRLSDGIPVVLETRLALEVAGAVREETLPGVLPEGFVPMTLESALPVRLDPDGQLHVQVRAGSYIVSIGARAVGDVGTLAVPARPAPWPRQEIWSYVADARLRVAALEGADPIDPAQANVPEEWRADPSYRVLAEHPVRLVERARGASALETNHLRLERTLYLDFSHAGYTAVDDISGTMRTGWRLDMQAPYRLLHASSGPEALLITETPGARTGLEVRAPELALQTIARLGATRGEMPATGWLSRFDEVHGTLNLPPGHRLLAAWGADRAPQAWLERWRLLDVFLLLLTSVVALRLFGWPYGLITFTTIALTHQDEHALTWLILLALLLAALTRAVPSGRGQSALKVLKCALLVVLLFTAVPFALKQLRLALYPQLAHIGAWAPELQPAPMGLSAKMASPLTDTDVPSPELPSAPPPPAAAPEPQSTMRPPRPLHKESGVANPYGLSEVMVTAARRTREEAAEPGEERYAPGTVLQAGPGVPHWRYLAYEFGWSGPVESTQTVHFWIVRPFALSTWRVLDVVLLALLLVRLGRGAGTPGLALPGRWWARGSAAALLMLLGAAGVLTSTPSRAHDTPAPEILAELKSRLTAPPPCAPQCADAMRAVVTASTGRLEVELDMSALAAVAVPLPVVAGFEPDAVSLDGKPVQGVYRDEQSRRWIALEPGAHRLRMAGVMPGADAVEVLFPWIPHAIQVQGSGWDSAGAHEGRLLGNTLSLVRRRGAGVQEGASKQAPAQFAPFVRVSRTLHLGLDWSVETTVERLAPEHGGFTVPIGLLPGERVLTAGVTTAGDNRVIATFDSEAHEFHWSSALPQSAALTLTAPRDAPQSEVWRFAVSPLWHVEFAGLPVVLPEDPHPRRWVFEYHPRPGESLSLKVSRPPAAAGSTLAIDQVTLLEQVGRRGGVGSLHLSYRSTQGGRHALALPEGVRVTGLSADGRAIPIRMEKNELPLALVPGAHRIDITWESSEGARLIARAPRIDLEAASSNVDVGILLPDSRWVLLAGGAGVGPVILYWGELAIFIAIAIVLGRARGTPLGVRDWLLLGLGLSTFSWSVLLLFALWMFALRWRESARLEMLDASRFQALQLALFTLSIVALVALVAAIPYGLLANPDMRIAGASPFDQSLHWFYDREETLLPRPWVLSLPLGWYKAAMLLWALWLAFALSRWLPRAWRSLGAGGYWRGRPAPPPGASTSAPSSESAPGAAAPLSSEP